MVRLYVGITEPEWFKFLESQPGLDEVNHWQPGGNQLFGAIQSGELFLFKLPAPQNYIVGGGIFSTASLLPISWAWQSLGIENGRATYEEFYAAVASHRSTAHNNEDFKIGCRIVTQPVFWPRELWLDLSTVSWWTRLHGGGGKSVGTEEKAGMELWQTFHDRLATSQRGLAERPEIRYGNPVLITPRLGQGAFRVAVAEAYNRRCVITRERTLPVLEAAHIRPFARGGAHEVTNGILLRRDLHTLFDRGYVTISGDNRFEVSRRIKEEFENGRHYYALHGTEIADPSDVRLKPDPASLQWHREKIYLG